MAVELLRMMSLASLGQEALRIERKTLPQNRSRHVETDPARSN